MNFEDDLYIKMKLKLLKNGRNEDFSLDMLSNGKLAVRGLSEGLSMLAANHPNITFSEIQSYKKILTFNLQEMPEVDHNDIEMLKLLNRNVMFFCTECKKLQYLRNGQVVDMSPILF